MMREINPAPSAQSGQGRGGKHRRYVHHR